MLSASLLIPQRYVQIIFECFFLKFQILGLLNGKYLYVFKVSGEIVHYHNGKQVPAQFSGGDNVIHSHKNCMEWFVILSST